jgi:hypothetical protein
MATIAKVLEGRDSAFAAAEWSALDAMAGNAQDSVPEILHGWLEGHGWDGVSRPRPGAFAWQEAVLLRYLAASGGVRVQDDIMADTALRDFGTAARLERKGLARAVPLNRAKMRQPMNGYVLTGAGTAMAARLAAERSGGQVPREVRDDLAVTWNDAGRALVTRRLWLPLDDWHAAEAAAESAYASGDLLIRVIARAWVTGHGWSAPVPAPDPEAVLRVLGSHGGRPGQVLEEMARTPRARRAAPELAATLKVPRDLIYPAIYALERGGWVSKRSRPPGYIITAEGVQAAVISGRGSAEEGKLPLSRHTLVSAFGEEKTIPQWAADPRCKVSAPTLRQRVGAGEDAETAMSRGPGPAGRRPGQGTAVYTAFGEEKTLPQWAADPRCKVSEAVLRQRVTRGEDTETAMDRPGRAGPPRQEKDTPGPEDTSGSGDESAPDDLRAITAWLGRRRAR